MTTRRQAGPLLSLFFQKVFLTLQEGQVLIILTVDVTTTTSSPCIFSTVDGSISGKPHILKIREYNSLSVKTVSTDSMEVLQARKTIVTNFSKNHTFFCPLV